MWLLVKFFVKCLNVVTFFRELNVVSDKRQEPPNPLAPVEQKVYI